MADHRRRARPDRERVAPHRASSSRTPRTRTRRPEGRKAAGRATTRRTRPTSPTHTRTRTPKRVARVPGIRRVPSTGDGTPPPASKRVTSARVVRRRRVLIGIMCGLALVGFLFGFVYPTRTYLSQREQISRAQNRLEVLQQQTAALERDTGQLRGDTEVERIAREQYGLGRPGETRYVIVPEDTTSTTVVPATP